MRLTPGDNEIYILQKLFSRSSPRGQSRKLDALQSAGAIVANSRSRMKHGDNAEAQDADNTARASAKSARAGSTIDADFTYGAGR
jgi:hypothetical protein